MDSTGYLKRASAIRTSFQLGRSRLPRNKPLEQLHKSSVLTEISKLPSFKDAPPSLDPVQQSGPITSPCPPDGSHRLYPTTAGIPICLYQRFDAQVEKRRNRRSTRRRLRSFAVWTDSDACRSRPDPRPRKTCSHFYVARRVQRILGDIMDTDTNCIRVTPRTSLAQGEKNCTPCERLGYQT
jgi:hypothetical protein